MQEPDLFKIFVARLNRVNAPYMITGAVAGILYGEPRLTNDMDLVINLKAEDIDRFVAEFPLDEFSCPPKEIINTEINRAQRGHFNLIHHNSGFKADIYTAGLDELHAWGLSVRKSFDVDGEIFWVAPPEYVILRKLEFYREGHSEKHLRDIAFMLAVSITEIDLDFLEEKVSQLNLSPQWQAARNYSTE